jgi:hypothetical protein
MWPVDDSPASGTPSSGGSPRLLQAEPPSSMLATQRAVQAAWPHTGAGCWPLFQYKACSTYTGATTEWRHHCEWSASGRGAALR